MITTNLFIDQVYLSWRLLIYSNWNRVDRKWFWNWRKTVHSTTWAVGRLEEQVAQCRHRPVNTSININLIVNSHINQQCCYCKSYTVAQNQNWYSIDNSKILKSRKALCQLSMLNNIIMIAEIKIVLRGHLVNFSKLKHN